MEGIWAGAAAVIAAVWFWKTREKRRFKRSAYRAETGKRLKTVEKKRGTEGEYLTSLTLERKIRGRKRFVFNAYLPCRSGGSTEADIILVHEKGVVVIENKNYGGRIKGRADREYWVQILPSGRRTFYNPVYQNQSHVRHLKRLLEEKGWRVPVLSAVVFNDRAERLQVRRKGADVILCRSGKAAGKINRKLGRMEAVLDERSLEEIYGFLKEQTRPFFWVRNGQKKRVRRIRSSR